jgi:TonB family protein
MPEAKRLIETYVKESAKDLGKHPPVNWQYQVAPGEIYKNSPIIKYCVGPDGSVFNVRLIRSSGIHDLDPKLLRAYANWKFKPLRGRPVIETEESLTIDWR